MPRRRITIIDDSNMQVKRGKKLDITQESDTPYIKQLKDKVKAQAMKTTLNRLTYYRNLYFDIVKLKAQGYLVKEIAVILNEKGIKTYRNNLWTANRLSCFLYAQQRNVKDTLHKLTLHHHLVIGRITELANAKVPTKYIALILNDENLRTLHNNIWTIDKINSYLSRHKTDTDTI